VSEAAAVAAAEVVEALGMRPHPEGGWYVETWRAPEPPCGGRPAGSAILYLLEAGQRSHWHVVDAAEVWQWSAGDPLELSLWTDGGAVVRHRLGGAIEAGERPQVVVPAGAWQAARPLGPWTLVGCIVTPAFEFDGFRLAPDGWEPP
jgi:predicted cupin superfamily sugar epimerase